MKLIYLLIRCLNPSIFINDCEINSSSDSESCNIGNKLLQITKHISNPDHVMTLPNVSVEVLNVNRVKKLTVF
jgi:hypothetical protein